jgi:hypothetical protein
MLAVMVKPKTLLIGIGPSIWVVAMLSALVNCPVPAGDTPLGPAASIRISVSREHIDVDGVVMCSSDALEAALVSEPRAARVTIEMEHDVPLDLFTRVTWTVRNLGFEDLHIAGAIEPGWTLYPPQFGFEIDGCGDAGPEAGLESRNDS